MARVVELTLARYVNPEQGYRACLGLMRTAQRRGTARMSGARERALSVVIDQHRRRRCRRRSFWPSSLAQLLNLFGPARERSALAADRRR